MEFLHADKELFLEHQRQNRRTLGFFDRNARYMLERTGGQLEIALAFFDAGGYLLNLYANGTMAGLLEERGIVPGTVWTKESTGFNAVVAGLNHSQAVMSRGKEHTHPALQDLTICFASILFEPIEVSESYHLPGQLGGIAVFVSDIKASQEHLFLAVSLAYDFTMNMHFNQTSIMLYERMNSGILTIDSRMKKGQDIITYTNFLLCQALGIEKRSLDFTPLSALLTPEKNRQFYELVRHPRTVENISMQLEAEGGKRVFCTVSSLAYNQPGINAGGITAFISTPEMERTHISKAMGNTAVLSLSSIIGECPPMRSAKKRASMIANTDSNVMLLGESGSGKDVFAQAIHNASRRKNKPFIAVNCAALPRDLIASELFGYDSGAFTGAKKNGNMGKFELAHGGTIFLDEIGDLPLDLQATLLRVVEQKQFMRLGGNRLIDIDVKIISATNADIPLLIEQKLFRPDLYFRLSTMRLTLPPLRERGDDIQLLAEHFICSTCRRIGRDNVPKFSEKAVDCLLSLPWNGNVRELQNVMECLVQLYPQDIIQPDDILENIHTFYPARTQTFFPGKQEYPSQNNVFHDVKKSTPARKRYSLNESEILDAIRVCGGNRSAAAQYLGIGRKTLYRYMEKLGIK